MLLDIENGSVAGALVRVSPGVAPSLFGERRMHLPISVSHDAESLRQKVTHAAYAIVQDLARVAARLRGHEKTSAIGTVERVAVFVSAPWGVPDLSAGTPHFNEPLLADIRTGIQTYFAVPASFHTHASAALQGVRVLLPYEESYLIHMPTGEITETLSVEQGRVAAYATLPVGRHTLLRTLQTHAGLSEPEARSALRLLPPHLAQPLRSAQRHFAEAFIPQATELNWGAHERVYVVSHDGAWLARTLAESDAAKLFSPTAVVRHLHGTHASPHFNAHAHVPDLPLQFDALFVDSHYQ